MTRNEALLLQVAEEAAEVSQGASKCIRFGIHHTWHTQKGESRERLYQEFLELRALMEMCQAAGLIQASDPVADRAAIEAKKERVEHFLTVSRELGTIQ